jgi:V/A-type H+-transporting ATPase subunit K
MLDLGAIGVGAVLAISAIGSAFGAGAAGMTAIGSWKRCFQENRPAPFLLVAFVGAPLTQTIYGFILMNAFNNALDRVNGMLLLSAGVLGGLAMGFSAWLQGKAGAAASDALAETGKGFVNYTLILGLIETVALFVMVFLLGLVA